MRRSRHRVLSALALAVTLVPTPLLAFCRPAGASQEVATRPAGIWGLEAPDGSTVVWADFAVVVSSAGPVIRTPTGATMGSHTVQIDYYCPIDWSADSRYLLTREDRPVALLDQFDRIRYWTFGRDLTAGQFVDPHPLWSAVEEHWLAKGRDVSVGGGYYLEAVGWEGPATNRIVFKALRRLLRLGESPERFLGYWSVETTGLDPKLLAEDGDGFLVRRFGRLVPEGLKPVPATGPGAAGSPATR